MEQESCPGHLLVATITFANIVGQLIM